MKPYSLDLRKRVVAAVEEGVTKMKASLIFKVSYASVKRWCKLDHDKGDLTPLPHSGRPPKIRSEQYEDLRQQLRAAPDQILPLHARLWQKTHQISLSPSTLSRTLKRMGWSRKKKSLRATERDEDQRAAFRLKQKSLDPNTLVVLDETSTNLALTSLYGYAPVGERVYGTAPRNYGPNLTMICALTVQGLQAETAVLLEGGTNRVTFELYIREFLCPTLAPGQIVILDNLAAHESDAVRVAIAERGCEMLFLPPYSPDFSPIELAFSKIKHYLRTAAARTRQALEEALEKALALITPEEAVAFFRHCGYTFMAQ